MNNKPVIDLDINELIALMLTEGNKGKEAAISLVDESLSSIGPIANLLVQNSMSYQTESEYQLPRNFTGNILNNAVIREGILNLGSQIMSERGLLDENGFTSPLLRPLARTLSSPERVIHNLTVLVDYSREEYLTYLASQLGPKKAEEYLDAQIDENGQNSVFPVVAYQAVIISTRESGVVVAPNDYNSMLFDLQLVPPVPVRTFIVELASIGDSITGDFADKTIVYETKIPGSSGVSFAVHKRDGGWRGAFGNPEDNISYTPVEETGFELAVNIKALDDIYQEDSLVDILNIEEAGEYLARLCSVPLVRKSVEYVAGTRE